MSTDDKKDGVDARLNAASVLASLQSVTPPASSPPHYVSEYHSSTSSLTDTTDDASSVTSSSNGGGTWNLQQRPATVSASSSLKSLSDNKKCSEYAASNSGIVSTTSSKTRSNTKAKTFPEKLMNMLANQEEESDPAIQWLPNGLGFVISNPKRLAIDVLPKFFNKQRTEFSSFTRKLYWWGFRKTSRDQDCDSFHHPLFRRDRPELALKMRGQSLSAAGGSRKKSSSKGSISTKSSASMASSSNSVSSVINNNAMMLNGSCFQHQHNATFNDAKLAAISSHSSCCSNHMSTPRLGSLHDSAASAPAGMSVPCSPRQVQQNQAFPASQQQQQQNATSRLNPILRDYLLRIAASSNTKQDNRPTQQRQQQQQQQQDVTIQNITKLLSLSNASARDVSLTNILLIEIVKKQQQQRVEQQAREEQRRQQELLTSILPQVLNSILNGGGGVLSNNNNNLFQHQSSAPPSMSTTAMSSPLASPRATISSDTPISSPLAQLERLLLQSPTAAVTQILEQQQQQGARAHQHQQQQISNISSLFGNAHTASPPVAVSQQAFPSPTTTRTSGGFPPFCSSNSSMNNNGSRFN